MNLNELLVQGVKDCPVAGDKLPLVIISHGRTGWFGAHHDTAASLADAGFVVVAISHPGDNADDRSRVDDVSIALSRPADVRQVIDFMLGAWPQAAKIDRARIGIFGYSRGGYTGLAVIGGHPNFARGAARCAELTGLRACEMFAKNAIPAQVITHDPRIKAAVLADPGFTFLFGPADLKAVKVPVQLWSSELGGGGVTPQSTAALGQMFGSRPDDRVARNAGHFAFLWRLVRRNWQAPLRESAAMPKASIAWCSTGSSMPRLLPSSAGTSPAAGRRSAHALGPRVGKGFAAGLTNAPEIPAGFSPTVRARTNLSTKPGD